MADTKDIEPKEWRANPEITSENKLQTIISNLLHMQSCLSTYVSIEDMEEIMHAKEAFDSGQIDIDELLVVIQDARQNAEERQGMRNRSREDLQQTLSVSSSSS
ncbi:unnamed protein product [Calicophoron daubneyi]|uniref:Uncharacterized protein n=1 Tax=Calicophoron daubneyi TaxID=300641 RepID=A0AAV2TA03_CALDB